MSVHPTPWRLEHFAGEYWIKDEKGGIVTTVAPKYPRGKSENEAAEAAARRIVEGVNGGKTFYVCKDHTNADWNQPELDDEACVLCRLFYLEAQESLLEEWQQRAKKAEDAIAEIQRPLDAQMARLNETVARLNEENERLRQSLSSTAECTSHSYAEALANEMEEAFKVASVDDYCIRRADAPSIIAALRRVTPSSTGGKVQCEVRDRHKMPNLYIARASGEGIADYRLCDTDAEVRAFYAEMFCGADDEAHKEEIDDAMRKFADPDEWAGDQFHEELYCAEWTVWRVPAALFARSAKGGTSE